MVTSRRLIAVAATAALALLGGERPAECHKNHCHGPDLEVCGGGWKDHREDRSHTGPADGADSEAAACEAAEEELAAKLSAEAPERCPELHPCATCPDACSGCVQQTPTGRISDDSPKRRASQRPDGRWQCTVSGEVAFRCRCSPCLKRGEQAAGR